MNLLRALATVSSWTLLSRVLGYARDFCIARAFGASLMTDAFVVAFRIPNLLRRLFGEGAFSQAFDASYDELRRLGLNADTDSNCAARPSTMDRPKPVPLPTPLVVKNGSVTRANVASSMPCPVSLTEMQV